MSNYTITTNFGAKDSLPSGNAGKVIKGEEFTTEFTNIQTAINSKADTVSPTFTGNTALNGTTTFGPDGTATFSGTVAFNSDVTFDTNTMFVDVSENKVGIGTDSPQSNLHVVGSGIFQGTSTQIDLIETDVVGNNTRLRQTVGDFFIQTVDNSSANPVSRFNLDHATGDISFYEDTGTTPKFFWDASAERLGIGTTSPDAKLHVQSGGEAIRVNTANENTHISFGDARAKFGYARIGASDLTCIQGSTGKGIVFCTNNETFGSGEKARIDTSGNLLVGKQQLGYDTAGVEAQNQGLLIVTRDNNVPVVVNRKTSGGSVVSFRKDNVTVGTISVTASATAYNTSSDERLKENIADSADAGSKIDAIQIRQFDWKADGTHQDYGVIAQELVTVAPEAVHQPEDSEDMMGVDYSKLVPMLIKEVQSLRSRVAELENN